MGLFNKIFGGGSKTSSGPPAAQMPFLQHMWQGADTLAKQQMQQMGNQPVQQGQNLMQQGLGYGQQAAGAMQPFSGQGYGQMQMAGLQDQMQQYLGGAFKQAGDAAQMAGGFGGTGQSLLQQGAIQDAGRTLFQGAGNIMQQDLMRQQQAAQGYGAAQFQGQQQLGSTYDQMFNQPMATMWQPLMNQNSLMQGYQHNNSTSRSGSTSFNV